jgi:hypothetical protein
MVRLGLLVSALPLVLAGGVAPAWLAPTQPCISAGPSTVQMSWLPWQADLRVAFTDNKQLATVRVQLVDQPDLADFVVTDDVAAVEDSSCPASGGRHVAIVGKAGSGEPTIYLSTDPGADYHIFVRSKSFSAEEAAALIVGARGGHSHVVAALTPR